MSKTHTNTQHQLCLEPPVVMFLILLVFYQHSNVLDIYMTVWTRVVLKWTLWHTSHQTASQPTTAHYLDLPSSHLWMLESKPRPKSWLTSPHRSHHHHHHSDSRFAHSDDAQLQKPKMWSYRATANSSSEDQYIVCLSFSPLPKATLLTLKSFRTRSKGDEWEVEMVMKWS